MTNLTNAKPAIDISNAQQLRARVQQVYSAVALQPRSKHPFPVGRRLAENIGYSRKLLNELPPTTPLSLIFYLRTIV